jgi:hypothetical protein
MPFSNSMVRWAGLPAPERSKRTKWPPFLKAHWKVLAASDFLTAEVWMGAAHQGKRFAQA